MRDRLRKNWLQKIEERSETLEQHDEADLHPQLWTISQACQALNLGRTKIYELIWKEGLPIHKFGRATRISPTELQRWLQGREHQ
jgi:excisionase family DNA binding protein